MVVVSITFAHGPVFITGICHIIATAELEPHRIRYSV
jgi:predicted transcriptional regulator